MRIVDLNENTKKDLLGELLKRNPGQYKEYEDSVAKIIADVRDNGDKALFGYTLKYDGAQILHPPSGTPHRFPFVSP